MPSLAFVHIPTNASQAFQTGVGVDPNRQPGINDDNILAQQAQGWCSDGTNGEVRFSEELQSKLELLLIYQSHALTAAKTFLSWRPSFRRLDFWPSSLVTTMAILGVIDGTRSFRA